MLFSKSVTTLTPSLSPWMNECKIKLLKMKQRIILLLLLFNSMLPKNLYKPLHAKIYAAKNI